MGSNTNFDVLTFAKSQRRILKPKLDSKVLKIKNKKYVILNARKYAL